MLIAFEQDHAGKVTGQVCDLDGSVAIQLLKRGIVKRVEGDEPVKKLVPVKPPVKRAAKKPVKK